jgi:hypothetical protein
LPNSARTLIFLTAVTTATPFVAEPKAIENRQVLLLAGSDAPNFQASTEKLSRCFPKNHENRN